jgi:hypothetical protein
MKKTNHEQTNSSVDEGYPNNTSVVINEAGEPVLKRPPSRTNRPSLPCLDSMKAELERQQEEEKVKLSDRILRLLLDYEAANRRHQLLSSQLETLEQQREVTRIAYKFGRGSTSQILGMEDKRDRLSEQIVEVEIKRDEAVRELIQLTRQE